MAGQYGEPTLQPALPQVTAGNLQEVTDLVKETLEVWQGARGDGLDRVVTLRDLLNAEAVPLDIGHRILANRGARPGALPDPIAQPAIPPTPTNLTASGALRTILLEWDVAAGYDRMAYYEVWRSVTDALGSAVLIAQPAGPPWADEVGAGKSYYYWVRAVSDAAMSPFNAVAGTLGTTGIDVEATLESLTGQIEASHLHAALGARIDLIDGPDTLPGSVAARVLAEAQARATAITQEETVRQDADNSLALQISLVTAGVAGGFDYGKIWYFDGGAEGWTSTNASQAANNGWVDLTATAAAPVFRSPTALAVTGSQYPVVKARIKRLAGTGWVGDCLYVTGGHGESSSYYKGVAADPVPNVGDVAVVEWAMDDLDAGGTDWVTSTIDRIRLDLGAGSGDNFSVDWVAIGRNAPGASVAGLLAEQVARVNADNAEATARLALAATVDGHTTAIANEQSARIAGDNAEASARLALHVEVDANTVAIANEQTARIAGDAAEASARQTLAATVAGHTTAIANEQSARIAGDNAEASARQTLAATVNDNTAAISSEATVRANQVGHLAAQYIWRVDVNGLVGGIGIAGSSSGTAGATIDIGFRSNKFFIAPPSGSGNTKSAVFVYQSTATTLNGVSVPAGLYLSDAFVKNGSITNLKVGDAAIDDAKIANVSANKITAGSIAVGRYIQSSNYLSGSAGWRINGDGSAEMNALTLRGGIYASYGLISGITIYSDALASSNWTGANGPGSVGWAVFANGNFYVNSLSARGSINGGSFTGFSWPAAGLTGFHLGPSGLLMGNANDDRYFRVDVNGDVRAPKFSIIDGNPVFSGALSAATGTFAGSLSAATGTFAGSLSAATGTFAGSLSAATGTFAGSLTAQVVNTSNIVGAAVTSSYTATSAGNPSINVSIPSGTQAVVVIVDSGASYTTGLTESDNNAAFIDYSELRRDGTLVAKGKGTYVYTMHAPAPSTRNFALTRTRYGGSSSRNAAISVLVAKR